MTKRVSDYRELLAAGRWFGGLPAELQQALLGMMRLRRVVAHEVVCGEGSPPCEVFAVVEGKLRVSTRRGDKEAVITLIEPPGWCGEISLFDGEERSVDVTAEVDTRLVQVPMEELLAFLDREPRYWRDFGRLLATKLRLALIGMTEAGHSTVGQRVAHRIVMMAEGYGEWTDRSYPLVTVSQETLALMVSSSRQTVNRELRKLETQGLVRIAYGGVEALDLRGLEDVARGHDAPRTVRQSGRVPAVTPGASAPTSRLRA
jgi:CRP/FNR family transcriptional regulator, cyclic AMP receptor protein